MNEPVLVVGADPGMQLHLASLLQRWGYTPVPARSVGEAFAALSHSRFLFSLVDEELGGADTREIIPRLRHQGGAPGPIIMLTDPNTTTRGQEASSAVTDAVLPKPVESAMLESAIRDILSRPRHSWVPGSAEDSRVTLEQEIALWRSPKMQRVWGIIQQAARVDVPVLIRGETGTGKSLVARAIHHLSAREGRPFVTVNCAAAHREFLEGELFGREPGNLTGDEQARAGKFASANHGTIFLDQVGDLPSVLQARLLHLVRDGELPRVGGESAVKVDVRILAASNRDLERAVALGEFRQDLYYRLSVIPILVPPLRERVEEIPLFVNYFIERYSRQFQREGFTLSSNAMAKLLGHRYPGNVRELENFVTRMILLNDPDFSSSLGSRIEAGEAWRDAPEPTEARARSLKEIGRAAARAAEREAIAKALEQTGWNRVRAARLLKISYRALLYKIKDAGLTGPRPDAQASELKAG